MSRVAKNPIVIPKGVEVKLSGQAVNVKGPKGTLDRIIHDSVEAVQNDGQLQFSAREGAENAHALSGTMRSVVNNMVVGVSAGFEKKLKLVGVGYRAALKGKTLDLSIGFSHPVIFNIPEGITVEVPSQTEVVVKGIDKQLVGQVAADIRAYRPPEPYKGKGVRYADEHVIIKEVKKK